MDSTEYNAQFFDQFKDSFKPGDLYLDVFGHLTVCICVHLEEGPPHDYKDILLEGVSLYDATYPRGCSVLNSSPEKVPYEVAWKLKEQYERTKNIPSIDDLNRYLGELGYPRVFDPDHDLDR